MTKLESARESLEEKLRGQVLFLFVGVGKSALFVYVNAVSSLTEIPEKWEGFSVIVREMDNPTSLPNA